MTGTELRQRREALGIGQTTMARYMGISVHTYRHWEYGQRRIGFLQECELDSALSFLDTAQRRGVRLKGYHGTWLSLMRDGPWPDETEEEGGQ